MPKVKNVSQSRYVGPSLEVEPGEVVEVSAERAAYLLSDECPGSFESADEKKADPKKGGK